MKIDVIINSRSDRARSADFELRLREEFRKHDYRLIHTNYAGHAAELARAAAEQGCDIIVAIGGDGTVNEVVNGSRGSGLAVGIIPAGAANDLAVRLGIPEDMRTACDVILSGRIRQLPAIEVNERYFLTTCGLGFPAVSIEAAHFLGRTFLTRRIKDRLGHRIYAIGVAAALAARLPDYSMRLCGGDICTLTHSMSVIIGLQSTLGKRFVVLPEADDTAHTLDCYIIEGRSRGLLLRHIAATLRATQADLPGARFLHGNHFTIETTRPAPFFGDGEIVGPANRFDIRIVPRAVPVIVPASWRDRP
jgi:diacylglycerol kinase (ATP)